MKKSTKKSTLYHDVVGRAQHAGRGLCRVAPEDVQNSPQHTIETGDDLHSSVQKLKGEVDLPIVFKPCNVISTPELGSVVQNVMSESQPDSATPTKGSKRKRWRMGQHPRQLRGN